MQARGIHSGEDREFLVEFAIRDSKCIRNEAATTFQEPCVAEASDDAQADPDRARSQSRTSTSSCRLPGLQTLWDLRTSEDTVPHSKARTAVIRVSRRLVELASLLGAASGKSNISVADMVMREPRLLTADLDTMTQRLLHLHIKLAGHMDTVELLQHHPNLLLDSSEDPR
jgi:hypothetical protein